MFGIGETELLIIVAFGFMIFGPDKLPGMGRTIGRALRQFRQAQEGFTEVVQTEVMDPLQEAMGDPLDTGTRKKHRATAEERAAALAADADIDAPEGEAAPARKETFAERKARLAAEKKAREEQKAAKLAEAQANDEDMPEASEPEESAEAMEPVEEPAVPDTSAAALYAMGGQSSFGAAKRQAAEEAAAAEAEAAAEVEPAAEAEAAAEAESEPAAEAEPEPAAEPDPTTDGKEAGSEEA